jgi:hypothetical protein
MQARVDGSAGCYKKRLSNFNILILFAMRTPYFTFFFFGGLFSENYLELENILVYTNVFTLL